MIKCSNGFWDNENRLFYSMGACYEIVQVTTSIDEANKFLENNRHCSVIDTYKFYVLIASDSPSKPSKLYPVKHFKYVGEDSGFFTTYFKSDKKLYAIIPGGLYTATKDGEPCTPIARDILKFCIFDVVPNTAETATLCNAWISHCTGGFIEGKV